MILDKLLEYAQVSAAINMQCLVRGRWQLHNPAAPGRAYVHIVLSGTGVLERPDAEPQRLYAGDLVFLPQGMAHSICDFNGQGEAVPLQMCRKGAWTLGSNADGREDMGMLCGHFDYQPHSGLLEGWPPLVVVPWQQLPQLRAWVDLLQMEAALADEHSEGAASVINGLSLTLLAWLIRHCWQQPQWQKSAAGGLAGAARCAFAPVAGGGDGRTGAGMDGRQYGRTGAFVARTIYARVSGSLGAKPAPICDANPLAPSGGVFAPTQRQHCAYCLGCWFSVGNAFCAGV